MKHDDLVSVRGKRMMFLDPKCDIILAKGNDGVVGSILGSNMFKMDPRDSWISPNFLMFHELGYRPVKKPTTFAELSAMFKAVSRQTGCPIFYTNEHIVVDSVIAGPIGGIPWIAPKSKGSGYHVDRIPAEYSKGNGITGHDLAVWRLARSCAKKAESITIQGRMQCEYRVYLPNDPSRSYISTRNEYSQTTQQGFGGGTAFSLEIRSDLLLPTRNPQNLLFASIRMAKGVESAKTVASLAAKFYSLLFKPEWSK